MEEHDNDDAERNWSEINGGRAILNQHELNDAMIRLIETRSKNETFHIFNAKNYETIESVIDIMSGVKAIISPHGGSLSNARFAPINTLVLEVMPISNNGEISRPPMFWEQSSLSEQRYAVYLAETVTFSEDMNISDMDGFVQFMNYQLDQSTANKSKPLEKYYEYVAE